MPADSSRGLSPAPCLRAAQKDRSQLFPAHCDGVSRQWRSERSLGVCWQREESAAGAQEAKVLKCSSGETPTGGSCCYFPDNCPRCAAGWIQWPARCHLACAETVTHGKGPAEEGRAGREEKEGPAATTSLCVLSFHAGIKVHVVTHTDGSWGLGGSCSSVKSVGCSVERPYTPFFLVFLSPVKGGREHFGLPRTV